MRLSHRDFDALQTATLELYEHRTLESLRLVAPGIFMKMIPADYFGLTSIKIEAKQIRIIDYWEAWPWITAETIGMMERVRYFDHPFTKYAMDTGDLTALKFSDFYSLRQLRESELYMEFYRHIGVERLLGIASFAGPVPATLNFTRGSNIRDFSERDRLMLNLMSPHFDQARRNAEGNQGQAAETRPLEEYRLTPRESEVAHWLAKGKTNVEIAVILSMRARTVEKHVERILVKLAVENRTVAAVVLANANGADRGQRVPKAAPARTKQVN